jgi:hypothetical protein
MDNPYQSPQEPTTPFGWQPPVKVNRRPRGLVNHVRAIAILMLVQGGLEAFAALLFGFFAVAIGPLLNHQQMTHQEMQPQPNVLPPEQFVWIMTATYVVMAAASLVVAVLHITAGVRNCRFRGKVLGIVALTGGAAATLLSPYCIPTAFALAIYGLIVYLNRSVSEAFRMGEAGCPSSEILSTFQL